MIVQLVDKELYLTYTWSSKDHGICGHTYEVIDYFMILNKHISCGLFLPELNDALLDKVLMKYNFTDEECQVIKSAAVFGKKPKIIRAKNILFTDGGITNLSNITVFADNVILFACGSRNTNTVTKDNWCVLQDDRIYEKGPRTIDYRKKILLDRLVQVTPIDRTFLYLTENCRSLDIEDVKYIVSKENNILIGTNHPDKYQGLDCEAVQLPIDNIFNKFNKYIYTPVSRHWDCSPRFIVECEHYGIEVEYYNIDYLDEDLGLKVRIDDIKNNFIDLYLQPGDTVIEILKGIINGN